MSRLKSGDIAPVFETKDYLGNPFTLEPKARGYIFLSFYRYATCPLCNLRMQALIKAHAQLASANVELVAVWQSPAHSIRKQMEMQKPPFPVIADPAHEFYKLYGVENSWRGFLRSSRRLGDLVSAARHGYWPKPWDGPVNRIPADFIIGPDGRIVDAYYGKDAGDHMPLEQLLSKVK